MQRLLRRGCALPTRLTVMCARDTAEEQLLAVVTFLGTKATALVLHGDLSLTTGAAAVHVAAALPLLQSLSLRLSATPHVPAVMGLLGVLGPRLHKLSLTALGPAHIPVDALALLCSCHELQELYLSYEPRGFSEAYAFPISWVCGLTKLHTLSIACDLGYDYRPQDLARLSTLTGLTSLHLTHAIPYGDGDEVERGDRAEHSSPEAATASAERGHLASALGSLTRLRKLQLDNAVLGQACLRALQACPVTAMAALYFCGANGCGSGGRAGGGDVPPLQRLQLPPLLQHLALTGRSVDIRTLAALQPAPQGLRAVRMRRGGMPLQGRTPLVRLVLGSGEPPAFENRAPVGTATASLMRGAVALLAGRAASRGRLSLELSAWAKPAQPCQQLVGPHAPWLAELGPLACQKLLLRDLALGHADVHMLVMALPGLQELELSCCSWPAEALLLLGTLPHLRQLRLQMPRGRCMASAAAMACIQELCLRLDSLQRVALSVCSDDTDWGQAVEDGLMYDMSVQHIRATLSLRGKAGTEVELNQVSSTLLMEMMQ